MGLFGRKPTKTPEELAAEWKEQLRAEQREIKKTIRKIDSEERKQKREIQKVMKRGDKVSARILAKEVVSARKTKTRLESTVLQLSSIQMAVRQNLAQARLSGAFSKSTEIMQMMGQLVSAPECAKICKNMTREMEKAGIVEEMFADAVDTIGDVDETEVSAEMSKVFEGLGIDIASKMGTAPVSTPTAKVEETADEEEDELIRSIEAAL
ncbi:Snf7 family like protein [Aduncisulcus paluster]|uniref:Snf7 family like protein n=1 Tax=Aduncisulcus paluster TaxID=2918883 RepID=A0ABQ5K5V7_9EUKA|nr:Snf7 family like protein [Aduncisulcus paluster]